MRRHTEPELALALICLLCAGVLILRSADRTRTALEQAREARNRRLEAEDLLSSRDAQLDGALEKIKELADRVDHLTPDE